MAGSTLTSSTINRIAFGKVMHRRHRPVENRFVYPVFFVLINLSEISSRNSWLFGINKRRPVSVNYKDYGDGSNPELWIKKLLKDNSLPEMDGPIWLQTFPRVLGFLFNPVSFWYCTKADGSVGAIVAEVNNTFGERHCYTLQPDADGKFQDIASSKKLYVSPFYPVQGGYKFNISTDFENPKVQIDYYDDGELQLNTAIWGKSRPLSQANLLRGLLRQPLLTFGVVAKIHWQALRLWLKKVPLITKPSSSIEERRT